MFFSILSDTLDTISSLKESLSINALQISDYPIGPPSKSINLKVFGFVKSESILI